MRCRQLATRSRLTAFRIKIHDDSEIFLSVLVIGELRSGIERIRRRDSQAAFHFNNWLQEIVNRYSDRDAKLYAERYPLGVL